MCVVCTGCLQSYFGVSTIRVENAKLGWPAPGNEMRIQGVVNPRHFKQVIFSLNWRPWVGYLVRLGRKM